MQKRDKQRRALKRWEARLPLLEGYSQHLFNARNREEQDLETELGKICIKRDPKYPHGLERQGRRDLMLSVIGRKISVATGEIHQLKKILRIDQPVLAEEI